MKTAFEQTDRGTKVYQNGKHVKTIPWRYEEHFDKVKIDFAKKRLSQRERFDFEHICFLDNLKREQKYVYELVENAKPESAYLVNIHDGSTRYELKYDNGVKLRIDADLYNAFSEKDEAKFSNY